MMRILPFPVVLAATGLVLSFALPAHAQTPAKPVITPETWQEHWFDHEQLLARVAVNKEVALYFDADVPAENAKWMMPFLTDLWKYTKKTYGSFGKEGRVYAVFHQGRYGGGHPSTYFESGHDNRNVIDCGLGSWDETRPGIIDIPAHEVGHIVEGASQNVRESPAFTVWGDSKWIEFYQYDAYLALGLDADAKRVYDKFMKTSDNFPHPGTYWFRDWFYPLWRDHGHAKVMANYFRLLAKHFPTKPGENPQNKEYLRRMNRGEYIHFMSGAASTDLRPLATKAFGWDAGCDAEYQQAQRDFPKIEYKIAPQDAPSNKTKP
ncbi:MAG: hypothetical protein H7Y38_04935 [Armatimonadetes bacterium]|nr:hypothetical protein [Armatimonadota bacterium]